MRRPRMANGQRKALGHLKTALRAALVCGVMTGAIAGTAGQASADPGCDMRWIQGNSYLVEKVSPWMSTANDIVGNPRQIQFRVLSGYYYRWQYDDCSLGPVKAFPTAHQYRLYAFGSGTSDWMQASPWEGARLGRWDYQCAGSDPLRGIWQVWSCW
jgi:hypothetical protein